MQQGTMQQGNRSPTPGRGSTLLHVLLLLLAWLVPLPIRAQTLTQSMSDARRALAEAQALEEQGKLKEAADEYRRAIRLNPIAEAYEAYGLFLYSQREFQQGLAVLQEGLRQNPQKTVLRGFLGLHLFGQGHLREAYRQLRAAREEAGERFVLHAALARCAMLLEEYPAAAEAVRAYLHVRPSSLAGRDYAFRTQLSLALMRGGALREAATELLASFKLNPTNLRATLAQGELQRLEGRCPAAFQTFQQVRTKMEVDDLALQLAEVQLCLNQPGLALAEAAAYLGRHQALLARFLADGQERRDQHTRVMNALMAALLVRGDAAVALGTSKQALEDYTGASILAGTNRGAEFKRPALRLRLKQFDGTLAQVRKRLETGAAVSRGIAAAARERPGATPAQLYRTGLAYDRAGRYDEAALLHEKAVKLDPRHTEARKALARAYGQLALQAFREKKLSWATDLLERAAALTPKSAVIRRDLALVYLKRGKPAEALKHAEAALALNPHDVDTWRLAGQVQVQLRRWEGVLSSYARVLKERPDPAPALLAEVGTARLLAGKADQGRLDLDQALKLARAGRPELIPVIRRNQARAQIFRDRELIDRGAPVTASPAAVRAMVQSAALLPDREKRIAIASLALRLITAGQHQAAKRLIQEHRSAADGVFVPAFSRAGYDLLAAYNDLFGAVRAREDAVAQLEKIASRLGPGAQETIRDLTSSVYGQIAVNLYRTGKAAKARAALIKVRRLAKAVTSELRHNAAVAEYYAGNKKDAVDALRGVAGKVPLALCNLAVHHDEKGAPAMAYELFNQCRAKGAHFPNLKTILEVKRQILGPRSAAE